MHHALRCLAVASLLSLSACACAQDDYLNHLVFTNSPTPDNDFYTGARAVAPSTLESSDGRLPVETKVFFTPPNALRLQWRSVEGGSWDAEIRTVSFDNRPAISAAACFPSGATRRSPSPQPICPSFNSPTTLTTSPTVRPRKSRATFKPASGSTCRFPCAVSPPNRCTPSIHTSFHSVFLAQGADDDAPRPPPRRNPHRQSHVLQRTKHAPPRRSAHAPRRSLRAPRRSRMAGAESDRLAYYLISRSTKGEEFKAIGIRGARPPSLYRLPRCWPGMQGNLQNCRRRQAVPAVRSVESGHRANPSALRRRTAHHAPGRCASATTGNAARIRVRHGPRKHSRRSRIVATAPVDSDHDPRRGHGPAASSPAIRALNASHDR